MLLLLLLLLSRRRRPQWIRLPMALGDFLCPSLNRVHGSAGKSLIYCGSKRGMEVPLSCVASVASTPRSTTRCIFASIASTRANENQSAAFNPTAQPRSRVTWGSTKESTAKKTSGQQRVRIRAALARERHIALFWGPKKPPSQQACLVPPMSGAAYSSDGLASAQGSIN